MPVDADPVGGTPAAGDTAWSRPVDAPPDRVARPAALAGVVAALLSAAWSWQPSPWTDEAATLDAATRPLPDLWRMLGTVDAVHGAYYLLLHAWVAVAGTSVVALRAPSALAVGGTAAALYVLVRRLGGCGRLAGTAAAVVAVLPRSTWAGAEARPYALTALVAVLLTLVAVRAAGAAGPAGPAGAAGLAVRWWAGYAVLGGLAVVVNVYLALLVVAHGVSLALRPSRGVLVRFVVAGAAAALLSAPVVLAATGQTGQLGPERPGVAGLLREVAVNDVFLGDTPTPGTAVRTGLTVHGPGDLWQPAAVALALAGLALAVLGVRAARRAGGYRADLARWTLPWAVLPPVLVVAATLAGPPLYNPRYFTFTVPAAAVLVVLGLEALPRRAALGAAVAVLLLAAPVYVSQRGSTAKSGADWTGVADRVAAGREAGDGVYFAPRTPQGAALGAAAGAPVRKTSREIEVAYPDAFAGLTDVTLVTTPDSAGDLTGRSATLLASGDRLRGLRRLWVLRREDYPPAAAAAEDAFLAAAGFRPAGTWPGVTTRVVLLRR
jgi:mannosyltransferase